MQDQESHAKLSAKDAKNLLREMRKEHVPAVSRMHKRDVLAEIERLKVKREETPPVAATPAARPKKQNPMVESIKEAKAKEFPVAPESAPKSEKKSAPKKKSVEKSAPAPEPEKKSGRPAKGSPEAKAHMAKIRAIALAKKKGKKD